MIEKSNYNMIMSIVTCIMIIPFFVLGIIFQSIKGKTLTVILMSIFYSLMITHFILKSIYYGKTNNKEPLYRLSNVFLDLTTALITINFSLLLTSPINWILFGVIIGISILEIILDSIGKEIEIKYLLSMIKAIIWIFILLNLYNCNIVLLLEFISVLVLFTSSILGKTLKNKIILSFDMISVVLFGIFLILI